MRRRFTFASIVVTGLITIAALSQVALAEPGSDADPLIARSYLEQYVEAQIAALKASLTEGTEAAGEATEPVSTEALGQIEASVAEVTRLAGQAAGDAASSQQTADQAIQLANQAVAIANLINRNLTEMQSQLADGLEQAKSASATMRVIRLDAGQRLIGGEGAELVLRSGRALVIDITAQGIADLTAGRNLMQGDAVPAQHLMLIPRADGRGLHALTEIYLLVRGEYVVQ